MIERGPDSDALLLRRTIERLHLETGLSADSVHELMEAVAALLLDRARGTAFSDDSSITVTAGGLRDELLALGLPPHQVTTPNVEKVLESLLAMVR